MHLALIAFSAYAIFFPQHRSGMLQAVVGVLFLTETALFIYRDWKSGLLSSTPKQIYERFREVGPPKTPPIEILAFVMGFVAFIVISW